MGLIETLRYPPGGQLHADQRQRISLVALLSPQEKAQLEGIREKHGKNKVAQARAIAQKWDMENKFDDVEAIVKLIDAYGARRVEGAMDKVADYSPNNSARNVAYLEEVIHNEH